MTDCIQEYRERFGDTWADGLERAPIPDHMKPGIVRYVIRGVAPGHFLQAVFKNDLMAALQRADDTNKRLLWEYGNILYNYTPVGCYGSDEKFKAWVEAGGANGIV